MHVIRVQSPESSQSDWSTKVCKLFSIGKYWTNIGKFLAGKKNCPMENWNETIANDLQLYLPGLKKLELCCQVKMKELFCPNNCS